MGSKGIKAIVVNADEAVAPEVADSALLKETIQDVARLLTEDPKSKNRKLYGTLDILAVANQTGLMPTRNFSSGTFENVDKITGPGFSALVAERGGIGRSGTPCVPGCTVQCSNVFADAAGENKIVASLQYESVVMLGPNLGIGDVDTIGELNNLCNEVGVDSIECGAALGVAMEAGVAAFGDGKAAKDMIRQIGEGTYLGRILGNGAKFTGQAFGIRRVPAVKGQGMPAYDPRALKGNGVLYATSTMGADHTAGNAFETLRTTNPLGKREPGIQFPPASNPGCPAGHDGCMHLYQACLCKRPQSAGALVQGKIRLGYHLPGDPQTGRTDPGNGEGIQLQGGRIRASSPHSGIHA